MTRLRIDLNIRSTIMIDTLSLKQLAVVQNTLAANYEGIEKVARFSDKKKALTKVRASLEATGEKLIFVLKPDFKKRGVAATERFATYKDGMLSLEYVEAVGPEYGRRDLRHDSQHGLIKLVA